MFRSKQGDHTTMCPGRETDFRVTFVIDDQYRVYQFYNAQNGGSCCLNIRAMRFTFHILLRLKSQKRNYRPSKTNQSLSCESKLVARSFGKNQVHTRGQILSSKKSGLL